MTLSIVKYLDLLNYGARVRELLTIIGRAHHSHPLLHGPAATEHINRAIKEQGR